MISSLYEALRQAKVPDETARQAAEEVAGYENRIAQVEKDLQILKWMVGANIALTLLILGRLFSA